MLEQAEALTQRYHVVVANPPYMGSGGMNPRLRSLAQQAYLNSKADLFAMFMERHGSLAANRGYCAMVTMQAWMFLSSYEQFRRDLLGTNAILTLIQIGFNSFPEMNSKIAQACAFVLKRSPQMGPGIFLNLNDAPQSADKESVFFKKLGDREVFRGCTHDFEQIPGSPIAYWLSAPDSTCSLVVSGWAKTM